MDFLLLNELLAGAAQLVGGVTGFLAQYGGPEGFPRPIPGSTRWTLLFAMVGVCGAMLGLAYWLSKDNTGRG